MKNIKSIELILENCDSIKIERDKIGEFFLGEIETKIARMAVNSIAKYKKSNLFLLELFKKADVNYHPFGMDEEESVFNRLTTWHDITGIDIIYENGKVENYLFSYDEGEYENELGAVNINEDTYISELGNLYIVISKDKKKVTDYFSLEDINDEAQMKFKEQMYE